MIITGGNMAITRPDGIKIVPHRLSAGLSNILKSFPLPKLEMAGKIHHTTLCQTRADEDENRYVWRFL
jgi:hypothetical protein